MYAGLAIAAVSYFNSCSTTPQNRLDSKIESVREQVSEFNSADDDKDTRLRKLMKTTTELNNRIEEQLLGQVETGNLPEALEKLEGIRRNNEIYLGQSCPTIQKPESDTKPNSLCLEDKLGRKLGSYPDTVLKVTTERLKYLKDLQEKRTSKQTVK